jgi:hypothetical protein
VRAASSSFLSFLTRTFAVSFILTKARCLNLVVESGSTSPPATRKFYGVRVAGVGGCATRPHTAADKL